MYKREFKAEIKPEINSLSELNLSPIGPRPAPRKLEGTGTLNRSSTKRSTSMDKENCVKQNIKKYI
mgnify:CR=1 FL=1